MERVLDVGGYGDKVRLDAGRITVQRKDGASTHVPLDDVAVLHGSAACALCCAGLNTSLGVNHCGPANPHCLASDLMEPFRTVADCAVRDWLTANPDTFELTPQCKRYLLGTLLSSRWRTTQGIMPLFLALSRAAVSLRDCLLGNTVNLDMPTQIFEEDEDVDACAV